MPGTLWVRVFVLDTNKQPLAPCHPARAKELLKKGKAAVYRRFPFTVILKRVVENPIVPPVTLKVDPGSKTTGIALVQDVKACPGPKGKPSRRVIFAAELEHRGQQIKDALEKRRATRRSRRQRHTRYRKPRFLNRTKQEGWLAPSLKSRVGNLQTWFTRFFKLCNLEAISMELVRFDMQLMQNAEVNGVEYQQGELQGFEVKEYLLEKYSRKCCYCGAENVPFEVEHITPKSRGGTNRVSNLCLACRPCNEAKGNQTATEFGFPNLQAQAKQPLKDASAVNSVRWALWRMFDSTGLPVEVGTGGRTKSGARGARTQQDYPKAHWIDAACVGESGQAIQLDRQQKPLLIRAMGRGSRQMCRVDKFGFPRTSAKANKRVHGFQTGDMVKAIVPSGKKKGIYNGRVSVRSGGSFNIKTASGTTQGISWKHCRIIGKSDGYSYDLLASTPASYSSND